MMAGGNAVCGSSAIAAIAPCHDDEEKGRSSPWSIFRTVMMLFAAVLGLALYGEICKKRLLGGTLQSVGQVVAGASLIDADTVKYAMLFKIARIIMLAVVIVFERMTTKTPPKPKPKAAAVADPLVCVGLLDHLYLEQLLPLPSWLNEGAHFISTWFERRRWQPLVCVWFPQVFKRRPALFILWSFRWCCPNRGCCCIDLVAAALVFHISDPSWYAVLPIVAGTMRDSRLFDRHARLL